jgi:hypothetical protein
MVEYRLPIIHSTGIGWANEELVNKMNAVNNMLLTDAFINVFYYYFSPDTLISCMFLKQIYNLERLSI